MGLPGMVQLDVAAAWSVGMLLLQSHGWEGNQTGFVASVSVAFSIF